MSKDENDKKDYSNTLNLPKTDFPMRGGLPQKEPQILKDVFENVQSTYPIQENGEIIFRFPRLFFTAGK